MKFLSLPTQFALSLSGLLAHGQGTFVYDQQSAMAPAGPLGYPIQIEQPLGQSFAPSLASIGFVQMEFFDVHPGNGTGATVYVNIRGGSITGPILNSTAPVFMPDGFPSDGVTNFFFSSAVPVAPGTTYYLQPVAVSGSDDGWEAMAGLFSYPGGTLYWSGSPDPNGFDMWFREGIVTPEPSAVVLAVLAAGIFSWCRLTRSKNRSIA